MKYQLPPLLYSYDALEPYIDAKTMEIHYTKHHQAYTDKLNAVLGKYPDLSETPIEELFQNFATLKMADADKTALRNNGGGYINHNLFWEIMAPKKEIDKELSKEIVQTFGSIDKFKNLFTEAALNQFGSGWAWLVRDENKKLQVYSTPNQDSPYLKKHTPVICLDVWEHAYYLKYQNRRAEYIENWWNVLKLI
jgi:Fe-Mn family superoxide dismutase